MTMRNDATRHRIRTRDRRRPRAVVARQGLALLDTDLDQQARALLDRIELETADMLGSPGKLVYPAGTSGFQISANGFSNQFNIGPGRAYLDGWLLENPALAKLDTQPHPRVGDAVNPPAIIAIKALVRHVDPVEEPVLADKALGDAQASGRALNDWQVFPIDVPGGGVIDCGTATDKAVWTALTAPSAGKLSVIKQAAGPSSDPCSLTPGGGYSRLENLLYRIEVHGGTKNGSFPDVDGPRFGLVGLKVKMSRRNASLMARITAIAGSEVTVEPAALDPRAWFAPGSYAEIVSLHDDLDPRAALAKERLFRVSLATDDKVVLDESAATIADTKALADGNWFLRLWDAFPDGAGTATVTGSPDSQLIDLGDGLSIRLHNGAAATFRRGDHWTFAARADGSVDWPESAPNVPEQMTPHGPEIRYAILATVGGTVTGPTFEKCSIPFFTLTDRFLFYRGGDGQSVFAGAAAPPFVPLAQKLRVAVMRGQTPVKGAAIRWSPLPGAPDSRIGGQVCSAAQNPVTLTDAMGLAEVEWAIDRDKPSLVHKVQATLATSPITDLPNSVVFAARFETAAQTAYQPGGCVHLEDVDNVQDALDILCKKIDGRPPVLTLTDIRFRDANGGNTGLVEKEMILNAAQVPYDAFAEGIFFFFDKGPLDIQVDPLDPLIEVELDLPFPASDPERIYWGHASSMGAAGTVLNPLRRPFGFQRLRLAGVIDVVGGEGDTEGLLWMPTEEARLFLHTAPAHRFGQAITPFYAEEVRLAGWEEETPVERILCRIRLRAPLIWTGEERERAYLNAEHLGVVGEFTGRELSLRNTDPQAAGDLDMFVYLGPRDRDTIKPIRGIKAVKRKPAPTGGSARRKPAPTGRTGKR